MGQISRASSFGGQTCECWLLLLLRSFFLLSFFAWEELFSSLTRRLWTRCLLAHCLLTRCCLARCRPAKSLLEREDDFWRTSWSHPSNGAKGDPRTIDWRAELCGGGRVLGGLRVPWRMRRMRSADGRDRLLGPSVLEPPPPSTAAAILAGPGRPKQFVENAVVLIRPAEVRRRGQAAAAASSCATQPIPNPLL